MAQVAQVVLVRLVPVAQVALVVQVVLVRLVPVAQVAQASAVHAQVSVARVPVVAQVHLASELLVRAVARAAVVAVAARQAHLERVAAATRPVSQSAKSAKSSNSVQHLAWVAQSFHAAMATLLFACVAVRASKTSQTKLMRMRVS